LVLESLDTLEHLAEFGSVFGYVEAKLTRLHDDVALAGQLADQDLAGVPDERRIEVLVAAQQLLHRVHVRATLVRKGRRAHPRKPRIGPDIGDFVEKLRKLLQQSERLGRHRALLYLELEIGNQSSQIAVANPLAVAVERALNVCRSGVDGSQRVGNA